MNPLFSGRMDPLTFTQGFLDRPLEEVNDFFVDWRREQHSDVAQVPVQAPLEATLHRLAPLSWPPTKTLFVATKSPWTAYFDNGMRGADPVSTIGYLSRALQCRGVIASSIPHTLNSDTGTQRGTYGATVFQLFGPVETDFLNYVR